MNARTILRRLLRGSAIALAVLTLAAVTTCLAGLARGYRPVVLQTGSMGTTAPAGSLIVAAPRDADAIEVGDIVVMRRPDALPITHRVIGLDEREPGRFATTQGDANETPDPAPYLLGEKELVSRWIVPGAGSMLNDLRDQRLGVALLTVAIGAVTLLAMRRIWSIGRSGDRIANVTPEPEAQSPTPPPPPPAAEAGRRRLGGRARVGAGVAIVAVLTAAGVVWSLYSSTAAVDSNEFSTAECFGARLASVQTKTTVHTVDGSVSEPIETVDPAHAFVTSTVRSSADAPPDSTVRVSLAGDSTVEIHRLTDSSTPPPVTVVWSVVEYECGVSVQRGVVAGSGTNRIDVALDNEVDTSSSFVLVTSAPPAADLDFDADDLFQSRLSGRGTLTIEAGSSASLSAQRTFAWQVVTFDDPDEIDVQTATATLASGATSATIALPTPVTPSSTFVVASITGDSAGPDIGERVIRARLVDAATVVIDRAVGGDPLAVHVQVVSLYDGTTVRHGTTDLAAGVATRDAAVEPVDATRSTAFSTVAIPGPAAGGLSDHVTSDVVGEASATFEIVDPTTIRVMRDADASNASFALLVVEWAGPRWWNDDYLLRQRIDVDTESAAPDDYTVAFSMDHASMVADGSSRPDGADVRVLRFDGSAWSELDRVLDDGETWNTNDTTIRFRTVDAIDADDSSSYWLYVANPAATAAPADPENVYLLVEGFESGGLGDFEDRTGGTGWYRADPWTRRSAITIPAGRVGSDLIDFPLLVSVGDVDDAGSVQPDGSDIRFTAADGVTPLPHEVESYDSATGDLVAWVHVPVVSASADTTLYLYWSAPNAPAQQDVRATWADDVEAVWHLGRDPGGSAPQLDDSSARNHDGLSLGAMNSADVRPGRAGSALDLDGIDDALQADPMILGDAAGLTISGWVRFDALDHDSALFSKAATANDRQADVTVLTDGRVRARLLLDSGEVVATTASGVVTTEQWHHVATTWDGSDLRIVVDGTVRTSSPAAGFIAPRPQMPVLIGNDAGLDHGVDGLVDEGRVEKAARSADWLAASQANQAGPTTFAISGAVETGTFFDQGDWSFRKPIVVDHDQVDADVTDFALLVEVTEPRFAASGAVQSDADDIVFTGADGTTRLDHVVEAFDPATGALTAWVSVPVLSSSSNTELFVYYGNPTAADQQDPPAVFGPDADLQILGPP